MGRRADREAGNPRPIQAGDPVHVFLQDPQALSEVLQYSTKDIFPGPLPWSSTESFDNAKAGDRLEHVLESLLETMPTDAAAPTAAPAVNDKD